MPSCGQVDVEFLVAAGVRGFSLFKNRPNLLLGLAEPLVQWVPGLFPGLRWLQHEVDHVARWLSMSRVIPLLLL